MHLASYGDASVLPLLHEAFDRHPIEQGGLFVNQALIELEASIEDLGGQLTPAQEDKLARAMDARRRAPPEPQLENEDGDDFFDNGLPVRAEKKLGRNEPCWCGSEKKYKKCHLASDEERSAAAGADPDAETETGLG
jgi:hypothetical protein